MVITNKSRSQAKDFSSDLRALQYIASSFFFDAKLGEMIGDLNEEIEKM